MEQARTIEPPELEYTSISLAQKYLKSFQAAWRQGSDWLQLTGISRRETGQIFSQLAVMLEAGLSLERGLEILIDQTSKPYLKRALHDILQDIRLGFPLHHALEAHHRLFPGMAAQMVRVGESGGGLAEMLSRVSLYLENQSEITKRILTALAYPGIVFIFAVAAVMGISYFIMPMFVDLYEGSGVPLPVLTSLVMHSADFIRHYGFLVLMVGLAAVYQAVRACRRPALGMAVQRRLFSLPMLGKMLRGMALMHITETMAVLLKVGVPALSALETARNTTENPYLQVIVEKTCLDMRAGRGIAVSLAQHGLFEEMYIRMIAAGEESGSLVGMLEVLSKHLRRELLSHLDGMIALLEPALILMVAFLVGTTVIATLMPMYGLMGLAGGL